MYKEAVFRCAGCSARVQVEAVRQDHYYHWDCPDCGYYNTTPVEGVSMHDWDD